MKEQVVRTLTRVGLLIVLAMVPAVASAQTLSGRMKANIPFDFTVADKKLPAGDYSIVRAQQGSGDLVLMISSADGHDRVIRITSPVVALDPKKKGTLVFNRYGDEYFLSQVWAAGATTGRMFTRSRSEREAKARSASNKVVMLGGSE